MQTEKRIAFITYGSFSHSNSSLLQIIRNNFTDYQIDLIDIKQLIKSNPWMIMLNSIHIAKIYSNSSLFNKELYMKNFPYTPYIFSKIKEKVSQILSSKKYTFTIQTQSLFDCSQKGIPHFVYTDHTHLANLKYDFFDASKLKNKYWIRMERSIYQNADISFTWSKFVRDSIINQYNCSPGKVKCIYTGPNSMPLPPNINNAEKYKQKNILFVGLNWELKGGQFLYKAYKKLQEKHPDIKMTIVGTRPPIDDPNINIIGRVGIEKMSDIYNSCTLLCTPSQKECFGIAFIEAMWHKLPVITADSGARKEVVKNDLNGYCIKYNDVTALSEKIEELICDPEKCEKMGRSGYHLIKKKYNWDTVSNKIRSCILNRLDEYN